MDYREYALTALGSVLVLLALQCRLFCPYAMHRRLPELSILL